jgi:ribosome-associated protein
LTATQPTDRSPDAKDVLRDLRIAVTALDDHKAVDIVVMDLRGLSDATDYFIVASGTSDTHVRALTERVFEALQKADRKTHHAEGVKAGRWALLDYVEFVVHVFHPTLREFYQLERLWIDARQVPIDLEQ